MKYFLGFTLFFFVKHVSGQTEYFRSYLQFDTIINLELDYKPQRFSVGFDFNIIDGNLYTAGANAATNYDFAISIYDPVTYRLKNNFRLPNKYSTSLREGLQSFDVKGNIFAILSFYGWQIYTVSDKDTHLICNYETNLRKESKNSFTEIKIINDSIICLARARYMGRLKQSETVQVMFYNFRKKKEVKRVTLELNMPELSYFGPNKRISFTDDGCYIADFDKYHVTHIKWNGESTKVIEADAFPVHKGLYEKLPKARMESRSGNNAGPILNLISPYYEDSMFIMSDISHIGDSVFFVRYIMPKSGQTTDTLFMNNYIDVWIKEKTGFIKSRTLFDPMEYEDLVNKTGFYTKDFYYWSTLGMPYKIIGNKIIFMNWASGLYPIGENKITFVKKEKQYLATHSTIPVLIIYEIKKSAFTR